VGREGLRTEFKVEVKGKAKVEDEVGSGGAKVEVKAEEKVADSPSSIVDQ
jgi:hypothetical protein